MFPLPHLFGALGAALFNSSSIPADAILDTVLDPITDTTGDYITETS